ncbi:hypothetical protein [Anaerostipes faecalis]|uniref:hypothetical protein n=1 Tax=Anaerostipes faecalis TaxID=2738446 RepID=UPI003F119CFE
MKMKLGEIRGRLEGLLKVAEKTFPAKVNYAVAKNLKMLESEFKELEEQRIKICESYADKDKDGKAKTETVKTNNGETMVYVFSGDAQEQCNKEYADLLGEEIDLDIHTVDVAELDKCDESERFNVPTATDYMAMEFMFK